MTRHRVFLESHTQIMKECVFDCVKENERKKRKEVELEEREMKKKANGAGCTQDALVLERVRESEREMRVEH